MNGISLDSLLQMQGKSKSASALSGNSAVDRQTFASMLAEQINTSSGLETDSTSETELKKQMIINTCLMMCAGGSADPMMLNLFSAFSGLSGIEGTDGTQSASVSTLMSLFSDSSPSAAGASVVEAALTRLGDPYSTTYRGKGNYVDCSSLVQWAYGKAGISLPSTSVQQAKYCYDNGYTISRADLQPGDLVFWSNNESTEGRWMNIHHVGIYAGDGKVIEAKNSSGGVVIDDIWDGGKWKISMFARPRAAATEA